MNKMKQIIAKVRELLGDSERYGELVKERAVLYMTESEEGSLELSNIGFHKNGASIIVGNMRIVYVNTNGEFEKIILYRFNDFEELLKIKK